MCLELADEKPNTSDLKGLAHICNGESKAILYPQLNFLLMDIIWCKKRFVFNLERIIDH